MTGEEMTELEEYIDQNAVSGYDIFDGVLPDEISFEAAKAKVDVLIWHKNDKPVHLTKLFKPAA